ncbi:MAG: hypothetical protein Q9219_005379 [cf. Caloplaca sp. 3 TL-2023]
MHLLVGWLSLLLICLGCLQALPATLGENQNLQLNTPNSSTISGAAPGFDCPISADEGLPINPLAMWQTALNAVYRMSAEPLRRTWPSQIISTSDSDIKVVLEPEAGKPSNLQTRFVIWSIQHMMFSVWNQRLWRTVGGRPTWQGDKIGTILIWKPGTPTKDGLSNAREAAISPLTAYDNLEAGGNIEFKFLYEGTKIDSSSVFLAALMGIGNAAEAGLDSRCESFIAHGFSTTGFVLTSNKDEHGNPILRYGLVRQAIKRMVHQMVKDRNFHEMKFGILQDGKEIAYGGCRRITPRAEMSEAGETA